MYGSKYSAVLLNLKSQHNIIIVTVALCISIFQVSSSKFLVKLMFKKKGERTNITHTDK